MVQVKTIRASAFCAVIALALGLFSPLLSYAGSPSTSDEVLLACDKSGAFTKAKKSKPADIDVFLQHTGDSSDSYTSIFGIRFTQYPGMKYTFNFDITTGGDIVDYAFSFGRYMTDTDYDNITDMESFFAFLKRETGVFPVTFDQFSTSSGNSSVTGSFTYSSDIENSDIKTFALSIIPARMGSYSNLHIYLRDVKVSYDGILDQQILDQLSNTSAELAQLSGKVDHVINEVEVTQEQIEGLRNFVGQDGEKTRDYIGATSQETQKAIDDLQSFVGQDGEKTRDEIDKTAQETQDAIKDAADNAPNHELEVGKDEDSKLDGDVSKLENSFDVGEGFTGFHSLLSSFWELLSSDTERNYLELPEANVSFSAFGRSFNIHLWDKQTINFSVFLNNYWIIRLRRLSKVVILILLVAWAIRFVYEIISWFLGDSDKSIAQIIFGFNPFS